MRETEPAVVLVRAIAAPRSAVYRAWTDTQLLQRWLAPEPNVVTAATTDVRVGGTYRLEMRDPDGAGHRITGVYRALRPDHHIAKTWTYTGPLSVLCGMETLLEVELRELDPKVTELTLTHSRIASAGARKGYETDWPSCMDKLQSMLGQTSS